jgi:exonuclease VII small subunit
MQDDDAKKPARKYENARERAEQKAQQIQEGNMPLSPHTGFFLPPGWVELP